MPESHNKFARMMQTAREHQATAQQAPAPARASTPKASLRPTASAAPKGRGRPATGKRSDPDYESTTIFLRRATKIGAARVLLGNKEQDLSDVLEMLLADWVHKNS